MHSLPRHGLGDPGMTGIGARATNLRGLALCLALALLAACGPAGIKAPPPVSPAASSVSPAASPSGSPVAAGCPGAFHPPAATVTASYPTALAFAPDGRLFYAERTGTIRVWQAGGAVAFASVPTVTTEALGTYSERGLLGLAISPHFGQDHFVYAFYSEADRSTQRVVRFTDDCAGHGTAEATVVANLPGGSDCCHKGGRLAFGTDGDLYVTLGETHVPSAAQDKCDPRGKVLRYTPDGRPAPGNLCGPVYAYGLRNPFGIAFAPDGRLFVTNNGPSGDAGGPGTGYDTVEIVQAGANYQWPACYGYSHAIGGGMCPAGSLGPDYSTEASTIVPTGATWVTSGPLAGHFVFCSYATDTLKVFRGPRDVQDGPHGCALDVKQGPDGALYFSDSGSIYRYVG
ncbi:MAG TPA: PQQ-dependent sugar dehydrogenase [Candidatus Dormibacteraeota bacterium]|nr:PQQ-dependent sugar dehydrogenase [Candidatus Dormibacteraeota bacterium]